MSTDAPSNCAKSVDFLIALAGSLEASALGEQMRNSTLLYPIANLVHLLGLVLLLGSLLFLDLRLLGVGREFAIQAVSARLTPLAIAGVLILVVSGSCMFAADAEPLAGNRVMQVKLLLISLGLGNALLFRHWWSSRLPDWDARPPLLGRLQALASLLIWLVVMGLGRLLAYF